MSKIKNFQKLAVNTNRRIALEMVEVALDAIDTRSAIEERVRLENDTLCINNELCTIGKVERIFVVGIGKSAMHAASALETVLGEHLYGGMVFDVKGYKECVLQKIECYVGTHPVPTAKNVEITRKLISLLKQTTERDLVLFVISGGGSTLLCLPEDGAKCVEESIILKSLTRAGANIKEVNTVRKHMSLARGGFLAKYAFPSQVISLIFSDVIGNDMEFVASGPTVKDTTTVADAEAILEKYDILKTCGLEHCGLLETPKEDKYFKKVMNVLFMSSDVALKAMAERAHTLGLEVEIRTNSLSGEAREKGHEIAKAIGSAVPRTIHLYGGETTVTVTKEGKGGRNLELALATLDLLKENELVLSFNTDGHDNTDYAGALSDSITNEKAVQLKINPRAFLEDNKSYDFFTRTGDYLDTGYTGSNVSDLVIAIKSNGIQK